VPFLGDTVAVDVGTPNPWMLLGRLSLALLVAYVIDASFAAWRQGERWRALVVGGGLDIFVSIGSVEGILVFWHLVEMPIAIAPFFLVVVPAMAFELRRDLVDAARLARELDVKDAQLRQSEVGDRDFLTRRSRNQKRAGGLWLSVGPRRRRRPDEPVCRTSPRGSRRSVALPGLPLAPPLHRPSPCSYRRAWRTSLVAAVGLDNGIVSNGAPPSNLHQPPLIHQIWAYLLPP
jgi:hypothetical protein